MPACRLNSDMLASAKVRLRCRSAERVRLSVQRLDADLQAMLGELDEVDTAPRLLVGQMISKLKSLDEWSLDLKRLLQIRVNEMEGVERLRRRANDQPTASRATSASAPVNQLTPRYQTTPHTPVAAPDVDPNPPSPVLTYPCPNQEHEEREQLKRDLARITSSPNLMESSSDDDELPPPVDFGQPSPQPSPPQPPTPVSTPNQPIKKRATTPPPVDKRKYKRVRIIEKLEELDDTESDSPIAVECDSWDGMAAAAENIPVGRLVNPQRVYTLAMMARVVRGILNQFYEPEQVDSRLVYDTIDFYID